MRNSLSLLITVASLTCANLVSYFTLSHNLSAGIYPIDADSIGLPLVSGLVYSTLILVLVSGAIFVPKRRYWGGIAVLILCGLATARAIASSLAWVDPDHYFIAIAYAGVAGVCVLIAIDALRRTTPNDYMHRTRKKDGLSFLARPRSRR